LSNMTVCLEVRIGKDRPLTLLWEPHILHDPYAVPLP
jgi:hypothetical protein